MADFFTSDLHLNHHKIIELSHRPFGSLAEMHEELIRRWNARVTDSDTTFVLGDMALGNIDDLNPLVERLNGTIILIRGNHDKSPKNLRMKVPKLKLIFNSLGMAQEHGKNGHRVFMRHFPPGDPQSWVKSKHADVFLCGHVHGAWSRRQFRTEGRNFNVINVGVDVRDFEPKTFAELMSTPARVEVPRPDQCRTCGQSLTRIAADGTQSLTTCSKHPEPEL